MITGWPPKKSSSHIARGICPPSFANTAKRRVHKKSQILTHRHTKKRHCSQLSLTFGFTPQHSTKPYRRSPRHGTRRATVPEHTRTSPTPPSAAHGTDGTGGSCWGDTTTQQDLWERGEGGADATQWLSAARLQASAGSGKEVKRDCKPHRYPPPCPSGLRLLCRVVIMTRCMQPASTASFAGFEARCIGVGVVGGGDGCWWWWWLWWWWC